ncbi:hypothetical protein [Persicobacter diffluens]|uniref:Lipoprotein n=1 Tax=Persicobacter diffluens TaxID=981 RepID=A0AAN4VW86_9BACT|nr:hypothetical protein PEDI_06300 [Persicobacter diffluens]
MKNREVKRSLFSKGSRLLVFAVAFGAAGLQSCKKKPATSEPVESATEANENISALLEQAQYLLDNVEKMSSSHVKTEIDRLRKAAGGNEEVEAILKQVEAKLGAKESINQAKMLVDNFENYDLEYVKEETEKLRNSSYAEVQTYVNQLDKMIAAREQRAVDARPLKVRLNDYMLSIANADSPAAADGYVNKALELFASPSVDVLIIIGIFDGEKDFDKPTTISQYLDYLKLQKKAPYRIENIEQDANGKIRLLELKK